MRTEISVLSFPWQPIGQMNPERVETIGTNGSSRFFLKGKRGPGIEIGARMRGAGNMLALLIEG